MTHIIWLAVAVLVIMAGLPEVGAIMLVLDLCHYLWSHDWE